MNGGNQLPHFPVLLLSGIRALGSRVQGFRVSGSEFQVQGLGFRV